MTAGDEVVIGEVAVITTTNFSPGLRFLNEDDEEEGKII
jgi:hypothetical protein